MQPFPQPNDVSDKIWLRLACWSLFESVDGRTHGRTSARTVYYKLTHEGELKTGFLLKRLILYTNPGEHIIWAFGNNFDYFSMKTKLWVLTNKLI